MILKRLKRDIVTKQMSHNNSIRVDLPPIREGPPDLDAHEKEKENSKNENCCDVKNATDLYETDVDLDIVQEMINNNVKPSFMVRTQHGDDKH